MCKLNCSMCYHAFYLLDLRVHCCFLYYFLSLNKLHRTVNILKQIFYRPHYTHTVSTQTFIYIYINNVYICIYIYLLHITMDPLQKPSFGTARRSSMQVPFPQNPTLLGPSGPHRWRMAGAGLSRWKCRVRGRDGKGFRDAKDELGW